MPQHDPVLEAALLRRARRRQGRRAARRDVETVAEGRRTAEELPETIAPGPGATAAERLIAAQNLRMGRTPPLASLETPRQRAAVAQAVTGPSGSRTTPGSEAREEISEQDRRMARFQALGEVPEGTDLPGPDVVARAALPVLAGASRGAENLILQPIRAARARMGSEAGQEAFDRSVERAAEIQAIRKESTGAMNRLKRAATFTGQVGTEVALIEAALAAAVPSLALSAGAGALRMGAREAGVGAVSEGAVGLAETGDVQESARRAAFGGIAGGAGGALLGAFLGRGARGAGRGAEEVAEEATDVVIRRIGPGPANEGVITRPDRLLGPAGGTQTLPEARSVQEQIELAMRSQLERSRQIPARTGGRGTGGQIDLGPGRESALEQAARISRTQEQAKPGVTGAAAEAIQRAEAEAALPRQMTPEEQLVAEEIQRTGVVPDELPLRQDRALRPGARVPGVEEAAPFPAPRVRPEGLAAEAEGEVIRGLERRAQDLAFEGPERRAGDRRNLPGARVGGELEELNRLILEGERPPGFSARGDVPTEPPANVTRSLWDSLDDAGKAGFVARSRAVDATETLRLASEPVPTGRAALDPPAGVQNGKGGRVERAVDPTTGKVVPDPQTAQSDLGRVLDEGPGGNRGGYVVNPRRDILERAIPRGATGPMREVLSRIDVGGRPSRFKIPSWLDLYTDLVDRTAGLKRRARQLSKGLDLEFMSLPDVAARLTAGAERRAEFFMHNGGGRWTPDGNWELTGTPGMLQNLAQMKGRLQELRAYLVAARVGEVGTRGIMTGVSEQAARSTRLTAAPEVVAAARNHTKLLDDALQYYAEGAGLPAAQIDAMRAVGRSYIPLDRVLDESVALGGKGRGTGADPLKALEGSEKPIIDPLESSVDYIKRMIRAGDNARTLRTLGELVEREPQRALELGIERIARKTTARVDEAAQRLVDAAAQRGQVLDLDDAKDLVEPLLPQISELSDTFTAWVNGERRTYRVPPVVAKAFLTMNPQSVGVLARLASLARLPARGLRAGVTLDPVFQFVNGWRDALTATAQSRYGFNPLTDFPRGFTESMKANWFGKASQQYDEFVAGGGGFTSLRRGSERRTTQESLAAVLPGGGRVTNPVSALKKFATPFEEAARIGEFMKARGKGANVAEAVFAAQDVTVNFQQMGASMQALSMMTAFLNAGVQSLDIMAKTLGRAVTTKEGAQQFFLWGAGSMAIPSIILWHANRDDQEIQELRKTPAGSLYWFVRQPFVPGSDNGEILRIPKPFVWGQIFGTGTEAFLDQMLDEDPEGLERFMAGAGSQMALMPMPNALMTPIEQWANKDYFFNAPITPPEVARFEPRMRVTERTSEVAKLLNEVTRAVGLEVAPTNIDSVIRDWGGTLTTKAINGLNAPLRRMRGEAITPPRPAASENAFFGRFIARNPSLGVEPVQTFWEGAIPAQEALDSYRELEKAGNRQDELRDLWERRGPELMAAALYDSARSEIGDIRSNIEGVQAMTDDMFAEGQDPAARKRELIDHWTREYVRVARDTNAAIDQMQAAAAPGG